VEPPSASSRTPGRHVGARGPGAGDLPGKAGVIRGYRLDIDPAAIGLPVAAWVRIRPGLGQLPKIADLARQTPEVSECHRVSGDDCFLLKVHVPAIDALEDILDRFLLHAQTTSSLIPSTPVPPRPPQATLPPRLLRMAPPPSRPEVPNSGITAVDLRLPGAGRGEHHETVGPLLSGRGG
jgi:Lrp/AsnC family leucine-responsive transcriptional regulator